MNKAVFRKTIENVRKQRDIKLVTTEERRNYLVWKPNCKIFFWKFISHRNNNNKSSQIFMNKLVYWVLWISKIGKIVMYESWYDYVTQKNEEKAKLCHMDTDSFIV